MGERDVSLREFLKATGLSAACVACSAEPLPALADRPDERCIQVDPQPTFELSPYQPECTFPQQRELDIDSTWTFPPASVSAVELTLKTAEPTSP